MALGKRIVVEAVNKLEASFEKRTSAPHQKEKSHREEVKLVQDDVKKEQECGKKLKGWSETGKREVVRY